MKRIISQWLDRPGLKSKPSKTQLTIVVFAALMIAGCSERRPTRVPVSGQVSVDGKLLEFGSIQFRPAEGGRLGGGGINENKTYSVTMYEKNDGLPPGKYLVSIIGAEEINETSRRWHAPKKYADYKTSGLTTEITEANKPVNFELSWEGEVKNEPYLEDDTVVDMDDSEGDEKSGDKADRK